MELKDGNTFNEAKNNYEDKSHEINRVD